MFITEYMTSGSLLQFLKTKKRNTAATVAGEKSKKASKVRRGRWRGGEGRVEGEVEGRRGWRGGWRAR